jgi:antitoxin VapB
MALSIKNSETERLARIVAKETGESITQAIQQALRERINSLHRTRRQKRASESVEEILRRVDALPVLDTRPEDEILGYDERGLPRRW